MSGPPDIVQPGGPRPAFTPQALILDLDGTVLDSEVRLHHRVRDAVRDAAQRLPVIVATGRMYRSALPWATEMHVTMPLVCYQGAMVREMPHRDGTPGATLMESGVSPAASLIALKLARRRGWYFQAYAGDEILCDEDRPEGELYSRISGIERTFVPDLEPVVRSGGSTKGVCVVPDPEEAKRCRDALSAALGDSARVTPSRPEFIEVVSPEVSKAGACAIVCGRAGVTMERAVAIGDGPNDNELLDAAGFAVAVSSAAEEVLVHADATCAPPQDAGVADALLALGLV
ncbi:MAG: HAD hydrolase family protein [Candidatus Dormibacteraeota bacterium]|nr:HAD hydrolase family protein [Candidatus Dormibacteraeota bacterium]MBV8444994.1 HAD hydrolase family protein [Candidatus Dormibacteraeota bacterium]